MSDLTKRLPNLICYVMAGMILAASGVTYSRWEFYPLMALYGVVAAINRGSK